MLHHHRLRVLSVFLLSSMSTLFAGEQAKLQGNEGKKMSFKEEKFGSTPEKQDVMLYTLTNGSMTVKITNFGGIVTELWVPDKKGALKDVVLGFDNLAQYALEHPYFGCIVGRYANRIAAGRFRIDSLEYKLATNNNGNHLHGGNKGFDKAVWKAKPSVKNNSVILELRHQSKDGEEGYPGNLSVTVVYTLNDKNELSVSYEATTDMPTVVNLTHHSYFNLWGAGDGDVLGHLITMNAEKYTVVNQSLIPTGELRSVQRTPMDFRKPSTIGSRIKEVEGGYDHNYVLNRTGDGLALGAKVNAPGSGRTMEVWTTEPGMQFYTGNFLDGSLAGKKGKKYLKHYGFCLEAQHYPDSPNRPEFPATTLRPGQTYRQQTIYKFLAE
ncbi:MAG: Aldose 1-epimerase [Bacteroidetes bacterium]|nr:Aldose 1-epimerase [Bacteroidota bacterium]